MNLVPQLTENKSDNVLVTFVGRNLAKLPAADEIQN